MLNELTESEFVEMVEAVLLDILGEMDSLDLWAYWIEGESHGVC